MTTDKELATLLAKQVGFSIGEVLPIFKSLFFLCSFLQMLWLEQG